MTKFAQLLISLAVFVLLADSQLIPTSGGLLALQSSPQTISGLTTLLPTVAQYLPLNADTLLNTIGVAVANIGNSIPLSGNYTTLKKYNVDPKITVSGISGGGSFSMMLSFIHSSFIKGAGIFAGAPHGTALVVFSKPWNVFNANGYYPVVKALSDEGLIDSTDNIASNFGQYIYRGVYDFTPAPFATINRDEFLHFGVPANKIKFVSDVPSGHCIPIKDGNLTQPCALGDGEAICDCNYSSIFEMFGQLYPTNFVTPSGPHVTPTGTLSKFNQEEFLPLGNGFLNGWWDFGYIYVPLQCQDGSVKCRLHMAFHGCGQSEIALYTQKTPEMIEATGYMQVADANNIIMVFPLARITLLTGSIGCFDIYGFTSPGSNAFSTRNGVQPAAIKKIYQRIVNGL